MALKTASLPALLLVASLWGCDGIKVTRIHPRIGLTPTTLSFTGTEGGPDPAPQAVTLSNVGPQGTILNSTAVPSEPWLTLTPNNGTLTSPGSVMITVSASGMLQAEAWISATSTMGTPSPREDHAAAWADARLVLWGGNASGTLQDTGGLYDASIDSWTGATASMNAPSARKFHTMISTGSEVLVWGGSDGASPAPTSTYYNDGHLYDPDTDSWLGTISTAGAPSARSFHTAVWTGSRMIIWGGYDGSSRVNTGGIYDPSTYTWVGSTSTIGAPSARLHHVAIWTGTEMIVWGGQDNEGNRNDGAKYDPIMDTWSSISTTGAPSARQAATAVWSGREMIVWGGSDGGSVNTGGRYNALDDTWVAPTTTTGAPSARQSHGGVWTGSQMIVSHGASGGTFHDTGGIYEPPIPAIGIHTATITITAPGVENSPRTITVDLTITP